MYSCLWCAQYWAPGPTTQAYALTGNRTSNPLVHRLVLKPLSHTSQGKNIFISLEKSGSGAGLGRASRDARRCACLYNDSILAAATLPAPNLRFKYVKASAVFSIHPEWLSVAALHRCVAGPRSVSYTHLTLPTTGSLCRSRWSPYH